MSLNFPGVHVMSEHLRLLFRLDKQETWARYPADFFAYYLAEYGIRATVIVD